MNIALYFGSFNPIHLGHLQVAEAVLSKQKMDQLWFVVSPQNPFKELKDLLSQEIRLNLVQKAIAYCDKFVASDIEFNMRIPSYTYDTMIRLAEIHPTYRFSIIMGGDTFQGIEKWKNYKELLNAFDIILYKREGSYINKELSKRLIILDVPLINISSTMIRNNLRDAKPVRHLMPDEVWREITSHSYYL